jgi:PAS domain S-box-containing protein
MDSTIPEARQGGDSYRAAIIEFSDDAVIEETPEGTILSRNPAAETLFGYSSGEAKGKAIFMIIPPDLRLDQERSTALFRILQEGLTNVLRHAQASNVTVELTKAGNAVLLRVQDDGIGIPPHRIRDSKSVGLTGMRERVRPCGGKVAITGAPGKGTKIVITVPVQP